MTARARRAPRRRFRQHIDPLRANLLTITPDRVPVPPGAPVEVELGSAEANFLIERAEEEPTRFYVGVEIRREWVDSARRVCAEEGLHQVVTVFANMTVDLLRLFPAGGVARFFLNFPDPWFKARQRKRRVMSPKLVDDIHTLLEPGGQVYVNTDIFDLALDAMAELEAEPAGRFDNLREPWRFLPASPFRSRSRRERECEDKGIKIWRLGYRRLG